MLLFHSSYGYHVCEAGIEAGESMQSRVVLHISTGDSPWKRHGLLVRAVSLGVCVHLAACDVSFVSQHDLHAHPGQNHPGVPHILQWKEE